MATWRRWTRHTSLHFAALCLDWLILGCRLEIEWGKSWMGQAEDSMLTELKQAKECERYPNRFRRLHEKRSQRPSFSFSKKTANRKTSATKDQLGWCQARCDHHPWWQCSLDCLNLSLTKEVEAVTHALRWTASRGYSQTTHASILTDSISLLQKVKRGMGNPDWHVSVIDIHLRKLLWVCCPGHAGVEENDRADRLAGKATITSGLRLGRI